MKRIKVVLFLILLCTLFSSFVSAATVTAQNNTSPESARHMYIGDTAVINGSILTNNLTSYPSCYFCFDAACFSEGITLTLNLTSTKLTPGVKTACTVTIYQEDGFGDMGEEVYQEEVTFYTNENKNCTKTISLGSFYSPIRKGHYFLKIQGGFWKYPTGTLPDGYNTPVEGMTLSITPSLEYSHRIEYVVTENATCYKTGVGSKICVAGCGKVFASNVTLPKTAHTNAKEWTVITQPTCSEYGKKVVYCTVCDEVSKSESIDMLPHSYGDWVIDKESSCSETGERSRVCVTCNTKEEESIEKIGHILTDWKITKEASCTATGERIKTCTSCGKEVECEEVKKLDHILTDWEITKEASCTATGERVKTCTSCGKEVECEEVKKLDHAFSAWESIKAATCLEDGEQRRTCSLCSFQEKKTIEKGHKWGEWQTNTGYTESSGSKVRICSVCKSEERETVADNNNTKQTAIAVAYKDVITITGTISSESDQDWYKINLPCSMVSSATITLQFPQRWSLVVSPLNVKMTSTLIYDLDDNADIGGGKLGETSTAKWRTVSYRLWDRFPKKFEYWGNFRSFNAHLKGDNYISIIPKLLLSWYDDMDEVQYTLTISFSHSVAGFRDSDFSAYFDWEWMTVKEPTCTSVGKAEAICKTCGFNYAEEDEAGVSLEAWKNLSKIDHKYGDWITIVEPTKDKKGTMARYCSMCKKEETKSVSLTHGEYGEWKVTKEATCEQTGEKTFICLCCGKVTETKNVPKLAHIFGEWKELLKALPERNGNSSRKCTLCGKTEERNDKYDFSDLKHKVKVFPNFKDVSTKVWYNGVVADCYHYALMMGNSNTTFNPTGNITLAEVITVAVRIWCLKNPYNNKPDLTEQPWYKGYVDFAIKKDIIQKNDFDDYNRPATRAEMAYILKNSVPQNALGIINNIDEIPDVERSDEYGEEILALYRAGVLGGSDENGTFFPDRNITRAEGAAIIARLTEISERIKK